MHFTEADFGYQLFVKRFVHEKTLLDINLSLENALFLAESESSSLCCGYGRV